MATRRESGPLTKVPRKRSGRGSDAEDAGASSSPSVASAPARSRSAVASVRVKIPPLRLLRMMIAARREGMSVNTAPEPERNP